MGPLATLFSNIDRAKRYVGGLVSDPVGRIEQSIGQAGDDLKQLGLLASQAYADPKDPFKVTDQQAWKKLTDTYLSSVMNFAPVGMFVGPKAATWNKAAASKAQELANQGMDPRQIWKETGTFKGPDGMWRQEIPDNEAVFPVMKKYRRAPFDHVAMHEPLESAYPDVKNIIVEGSPGGSLSGGSYTANVNFHDFGPRENILIRNSDESRIGNTSIGLHELQHAIQQREGWARGGTPQMFSHLSPQAVNDAQLLQARISRGETPTQAAAWMKQNLGRNPDIYAMDIATSGKAFTSPKTPEEAYRRLAGEAEARATQARMNMNAAQRREVFPLDSYDVPLEQLIVRWGGDSPAMAIDPKGQKRLVDGLLGNGGKERYRLGDITRKQADEAYVFGGKPVGESRNVFVTPDIGQEHARVARMVEEGFVAPELGVYAKQGMRPDSKILPPANKSDYPILRSESMLDPVTGKRYNAEMPIKPVEDGFEMISIIPRGLKPRKKPR